MNEKRIAVVVNPISGGGRGRKIWEVVRPGLKALFQEIDCRLSNRVDDLSEICKILLITEPDYLLVIGGDGTLSQAVNGFYDSNKPRNSKTRLAYLNAGCGGDYARQFPRQYITEFLDRLIHDEHQLTNIGKLVNATGQVHYFINVASCGLSGYVANCMLNGSWLKRFGSTVNYLFYSLVGLCRYRPAPVSIQIDAQEPVHADLMLMAVCNGQYFGGGMHIAPMAKIDDDLLDVVMFLNFTRFEAVRKIIKLYRGRHLHEKKVHYRQAKTIRISSTDDTELLIEADGEKAGVLPVEFSLLPEKMAIII